MKKYFTTLIALATTVALLVGCAAPGPTASTSPSKTGTVQMWVTDAPRTDNVTEIWVTVSEVKIHKAAVGQVSDNTSGNTSDETEGAVDNSTDTSGWITVNLTGPDRFDLLTLSGGLQQVLAAANLTEGRYTQIRMTVGKVEVKIDGVLKDAVLPNGFRTEVGEGRTVVIGSTTVPHAPTRSATTIIRAAAPSGRRRCAAVKLADAP